MMQNSRSKKSGASSRDVEELQRKFEVVQAQKERLERIQQQLERELASKGSNEFVLSTKVETLNQDLVALRLTFAGELDRVRRDFRNELACMEARLSVKVDRVQPSPSAHDSERDVKLSAATANAFASSSWFWNGGDSTDADCAPSAYIPPSPITKPQQAPLMFAAEKEGAGAVPETPTQGRTSEQQPQKRGQPSHRLVAVAETQNQCEEVSKADLVALASRVLEIHGSLPIGKMGSLLHKAANNHLIPSILKERYGGLKKFLLNNPEFTLDTDHPYNPHVRLTSSLTQTPTGASAAPAQPLSSLAATHSTTEELAPLARKRSASSRGAPPGLDAPNDFPKENKKPVRSKLDIIDPESYSNMTPILSIDCDLVGIGPGGKKDACVRCTIVNFNGMVVYDARVENTETVTDWRGLKQKLQKGTSQGELLSLDAVSKSVANIIKGRILIGHALATDLRALNLKHPLSLTRDTAHFSPFCPPGQMSAAEKDEDGKKIGNDKPALSLSKLVMERLGINFQAEVQPSTDAARAVLALYKSVHREWESMIRTATLIGTPGVPETPVKAESECREEECREDDNFGNFSLFC